METCRSLEEGLLPTRMRESIGPLTSVDLTLDHVGVSFSFPDDSLHILMLARWNNDYLLYSVLQ